MKDDKMRRAQESARDDRENGAARREAYLARRAEKLPSLVMLQERMAAGEDAHDVMREDERPWLKS